jgi:hypothetical protein
MFDAWESLGDHYFEDDRIQIAEIDCEPDLNKQVCKGFGVDGLIQCSFVVSFHQLSFIAYPTLLIFKNGAKADKFLEERTKDELVNYADKWIKEMTTVKDET